MQNTAYGASFAGGAFDLASFFKQPQTILRILSWLFSIVVFATITAEGYTNTATGADEKCMYNSNDSACSYGVGIGVLAFIACVVFLLLDAYFPQISNAKDRKYIVIGDLGFSVVWTFLWFICFCVLANQWSKTVIDKEHQVPEDAARAVIAFSFFSMISWGLLSFFAFRRYRQGLTDLNQDYSDPATDHTSPPTYASSGVPAGYQQSPFSNQGPTGAGEYQPPAY